MTTVQDQTLSPDQRRSSLETAVSPLVQKRRDRDDSADRAAGTPDVLKVLEELDHQTHRAGHALATVARSISANASNEQFFYALACTLKERRRWESAAEHFRRAIQIRPEFFEAFVGLGHSLRQQNLFDEAIAALRLALEIRPQDATAHIELADLFQARGDSRQAIVHLQAALPEDSSFHEVQLRLGWLQSELGETAKALNCFSTVLEQHVAEPHARFLQSLISLQQGDFSSGWEGFELRRKGRGDVRPLPAPELVWDEAALRQQSVLVRAEGTLADALMFASCLPELIRTAGRCVIECHQELVPLFSRSFSTATVVPPLTQSNIDPSAARACVSTDAQIFLGSLPRYVRPSMERFPKRRGHLVANASRRQNWQCQLDALGKGLKVGISWRGAANSKPAAENAVPLECWRQMLQTPGVQFISLQRGDDISEIATMRESEGVDIHDLLGQYTLNDLDELGGLISALDLVISVPNTVAHLAGALGSTIWTPLSSWPSWRWMLEGDSSPWYPSMRLYRQKQPGQWHEVLGRIGKDLRQLASANSSEK